MHVSGALGCMADPQFASLLLGVSLGSSGLLAASSSLMRARARNSHVRVVAGRQPIS